MTGMTAGDTEKPVGLLDVQVNRMRSLLEDFEAKAVRLRTLRQSLFGPSPSLDSADEERATPPSGLERMGLLLDDFEAALQGLDRQVSDLERLA